MLIKARLNDLMLGLLSYGWVEASGCCGMCHSPVPPGSGSNAKVGNAQMCHFFLPRCQHTEISSIARDFYLVQDWLGDDWSTLDDEGQLARLLLLDDSKPGANSLQAIRATGRFLQDIRVAMFKWEHARKRKAALDRPGRPLVQAREAPKMKNNRRLCSADECETYARTGGVYVAHGATVTRKTCTTEGCSKFARRGGVCTAHGAKHAPSTRRPQTATANAPPS